MRNRVEELQQSGNKGGFKSCNFFFLQKFCCYTCFCKTGVKSFIMVGLEGATAFEEALSLEFGRGFRYTRPLRLNTMDLDYELMEELVRVYQWKRESVVGCIVRYWIKMLFSFAVQDNIAERECCGVPCKCIGTRGDRGGVGLAGSKVLQTLYVLITKVLTYYQELIAVFVY